ncbi:MAG TPA: hypothetical protein VKG63_14570 [Steroidobacteraceae bacterium]|nr:hypothetical protein [Steroidobacteraceae bacterium]
MATDGNMTRHVQLLVALVATELIRPLMARADSVARIVSVTFFILVGVAVFRAIFDTQRLRQIGAALGGTVIAIGFAGILDPSPPRVPMEVLMNASTAAFFVFVLSVIVGHVFGARRLAMDDVVGAFSGYIVIALIWGRLYAIAWTVVPNYFSVSPDIKWQLDNWNTLHALFDFYSFATITSIGYGDITTTGPVTNNLVWLEVMCGQFYLAVVVATIVGIKMSQALDSSSRDGA